MSTLQLVSSCEIQEHAANSSGDTFIDMNTIRQRVATIKNRWSAETVRARAIEGARRRRELAGLVANMAAQEDYVTNEDCDYRIVM